MPPVASFLGHLKDLGSIMLVLKSQDFSSLSRMPSFIVPIIAHDRKVMENRFRKSKARRIVCIVQSPLWPVPEQLTDGSKVLILRKVGNLLDVVLLGHHEHPPA